MTKGRLPLELGIATKNIALYHLVLPILPTFQFYINKYLAKKLDACCIVYLDGILIYTNKKRTKHEETVRWVLGQLYKFDLYTNLRKCRFSTNKVHFLGYIVSPSRVYTELERIESIKNWPK